MPRATLNLSSVYGGCERLRSVVASFQDTSIGMVWIWKSPRGNSPPPKGRSNRRRRRANAWSLCSLEPRVLLAGDLGAVAPLVSAAPISDSPITNVSDANSSPVASTASVRSIVFVDSRVDDLSVLLDGISEEAELVFVDSTSDGISGITRHLQLRQNVHSVHIVAHGNRGELYLGRQTIDSFQLALRSAEISGWASSLRHDADILIYACQLGAGQTGLRFTNQLAALTRADVATSTNNTGAGAGADWILERSTGTIESGLAIDAARRHQWNHILSLVTDGFEDDGSTAEVLFDDFQDALDLVNTRDDTANDSLARATSVSLLQSFVQSTRTHVPLEPAALAAAVKPLLVSMPSDSAVSEPKLIVENPASERLDEPDPGTRSTSEGVLTRPIVVVAIVERLDGPSESLDHSASVAETTSANVTADAVVQPIAAQPASVAPNQSQFLGAGSRDIAALIRAREQINSTRQDASLRSDVSSQAFLPPDSEYGDAVRLLDSIDLDYEVLRIAISQQDQHIALLGTPAINSVVNSAPHSAIDGGAEVDPSLVNVNSIDPFAADQVAGNVTEVVSVNDNPQLKTSAFVHTLNSSTYWLEVVAAPNELMWQSTETGSIEVISYLDPISRYSGT